MWRHHWEGATWTPSMGLSLLVGDPWREGWNFGGHLDLQVLLGAWVGPWKWDTWGRNWVMVGGIQAFFGKRGNIWGLFGVLGVGVLE